MPIDTISDDSVWLTIATFIPLVGVLAILFVPSEDEATIKTVGIAHRRRDVRRRHRRGLPVRLRQGRNAAVLRRPQVDRLHPRQLHDRPRRDQPAAVRAVGLHHLRRDDLHVGQHARGRQRQGVRHHPADPAGGHGRHVHGPGPDPVLRVLRGRAAADVLHHRRVGRRAAPVRLAEVLPLHDVRFGADAGGVPRPVRPDRRPDLLAARPRRVRPAASGAPCRSGSSPGCSSASPSRCRCSRSTRGCPTPTPRRRPRAR